MKRPTGEAYGPLSRRDFLKAFAHIKIEAKPKEPNLRATSVVPQRFALDALRDLPEPVLRKMAPVLRGGLGATVQDAAVAFHGGGGEEGVVPLAPEACEAVRRFDGVLTLEQIGSALEIECGAKPGEGFPLAREAFLALSARGIYHPAGPPPVPTTRAEAAL